MWHFLLLLLLKDLIWSILAQLLVCLRPLINEHEPNSSFVFHAHSNLINAQFKEYRYTQSSQALKCIILLLQPEDEGEQRGEMYHRYKNICRTQKVDI